MTTNPDLAALLRAILDRPDDDTPRLVYADECEDAGEHERAEFVRVQCDLARTPAAILGSVGDAYPNGRHTKLRRRERALLEGRADVWFPVPAGYGLDWSIGTDESPGRPGYVVRRGFVDELRCPLSAFVGGERCRHRTCHGGRIATNAFGYRRCPHCRGAGRTGIDLAAVFSAHPITAVRLVDARPIDVRGMNPPWRWLRATHDPFGAELPDELFERIPTAPAGCQHSQSWGRFYPTRAAALDALSLAAANLGRHAAGLPPLT